MSTVLAHAVANNDRTVTARYFGTGNAVRTIWNLAGMDSSRAVLAPVLYKSGWGGIELLYSTERTNYVPRSQEFDNGWTKNANITITPNAAIAPDGTTTADLEFVANGIAAGPSFPGPYRHQTLAAGYVISGYFKSAGRNTAIMQNGSGFGADFNLSTGTAVPSGAGVTASISAVGNGWYRVAAFCPVGAGANPYWYFYETGSTGDGASGIYLWGAQIETGTTLTPYIPTTAASVAVTDYSVAASGIVTHAPAVPSGTTVAYKEPHQPSSNTYKHYGAGDGASTLFSLPFAQVTPSIYIDGVLQTLTTHYTVTPAGVVTFVTPPGNGTVLTWTGNFGPQR